MSISKAEDYGYDSMSATEVVPQTAEVELTGLDDDINGAEAPAIKEEDEKRLVIGGIDLLVIQKVVNDQLVMMMPPQTKADVHDLRKTGFAQLITIAFIASYLIALIYNSVIGHRQLRNEAFLSPDLYAGECNEVPLAITSLYEADATGKWDTEPGYVPTKSMYAMDLRGTKVTNEDYPDVMRLFQDALEKEAVKSSTRDLSYSMLALASYNLKDEETQMNFFTNARAEKVFGTSVFASGLTNTHGWCPESYGTYDADAGMIKFHIDFTPGENAPYDSNVHNLCPQLYASDFGVNDIDVFGVKILKFDMQSIATAVAVNLGMTNIGKDLSLISPPKGYFNADGEFVPDTYGYDLNRYVNPYYVDMTPIICFNGTSYGLEDFCLLELEKNWYYPMITQYGNWYEEKMCTCKEGGSLSESGMSYYCSQADFLVSIVYVPTIMPATPAPSAQPTWAQTGSVTSAPTEAQTEVQTEPVTLETTEYYSIIDFGIKISEMRRSNPDGDIEIGKLFHPAQFRSVFYPPWWSHSVLTDPFFALCEGRCSMFTIEFWGASTSPMNFRGTPVYSMFNNTAMIACSNGIYREEAFKPLIEKAPVTLVQAYYTCILNNTAAAQRAVGIAAGSAALYATVVLNVLLLLAIYSYNFMFDDKIISPNLKKKVIEDDIAQLKSELAEMRKHMKN
jgi:hypothetical protein